MADPARRKASYEDLLAAPPHVVAEIIAGELRTTPRPGPRHTRAASRLGSRLDRFFDDGADGPGGWWILDKPEVHFAGGDILVPDLAGWRIERMPELPPTAYFEVVPNWVCEVLSSRTEADDRADKMPRYGAAGVEHAWLVDPVLETLEVYRRHDHGWLLVATYRGSAEVYAEPFAEVALPLGVLRSKPRGAG